MTKLNDQKKEKLFNYIDEQFIQLTHTNTFTKLNIAKIVIDFPIVLTDFLSIRVYQMF